MVLFANNEDDLKSILNTFYNYCEQWKLDNNFSKTKVMIFGDKMRRHRNISVHGHNIKVVDSFTYLGVLFQRIDLLLYAVKMGLWRFKAVHSDFLKRILHVKQSTPHVMLYGDLGRYPVSIAIKKRTIDCWFNLVSNENKLSSTLYKLMCNDHLKNNNPYKWLDNVKSIFDECGLSFIWRAQSVYGSKELRIEMWFPRVTCNVLSVLNKLKLNTIRVRKVISIRC